MKKNVLYSLILTLSAYAVPLLVFPYTSRVLGPAAIGATDWMESIVNYSILFSMMGMSTLGIREIARCKGNREATSRVFSELFMLNTLSTAFVVGVLLLLSLTTDLLSSNPALFRLGLVKIAFNLFWIEWYYKGVENFRYITIRSVIVRCLFVASVYLFVKDSSDYVIYYLLWVGVTVANAVCNWSYRSRSVRLIPLRQLSFTYWRPFLLLGLYAVFSAVYTQLNTTILGVVSTHAEVAYYSTAARIYTVLIAIFSTFTSVMIPRMSALIAEQRTDEVKHLVRRAFDVLFLLMLPIIIYVEAYADGIICLFAGDDFVPSAAILRILIFQLLIIGSEQIFILQLLIPARKDRQALWCAVLGAVVCVVSNVLLVRRFQGMGSAFTWLFSELAVLMLASVWVKRYFSIGIPLRQLLTSVVYALPYVGVVWAVSGIESELIRLGVSALGFAIWAIVLEEYVYKFNLIQGLFRRFRRK